MADDTEHTESDIWASPTQGAPLQPRPRTPKTPKTPNTPAAGDRKPEPIDREAALTKELEGVRRINECIEGVLATLGRTSENMETVSKTVNNASSLLNTWTRILSQTEHNQRLVLHPGWKGATEDLAEQEAEALERQRAAERKALEEEQRREELRRRREEDEEKRRLGAMAPPRGTRGSSRVRGGIGRGASARGSTMSGYRSESGRAGSSSSRGGTSRTGRGPATGRGRSRPSR
ncbi:hypothetical protein CDD83_6139 [Cordyceps sp. RAO-2017]|nr:hypothetical protein CDD83_6139 [Cordyceps sp. RAO-2017]